MPQEERASRIDAIVKLERHEPVTLERLQAGAVRQSCRRQ